MSNDFWFDVAEDIIDSVTSAINAKDFNRLSRNITNIVDRATRKADVAAEEKEKMSDLYLAYPPGRVSGPLKLAFGIVGTVLFGMSLIAVLVLMVVFMSIGEAIWAMDLIIAACILIPFIIISICGIVKGARVIGVNSRYKKYANIIGLKGYMDLKDLARAMGRPLSFIKKDIKYMLKKGYFISGHMDKSQSTIITSDKVYREYLDSERYKQETLRVASNDEEKKTQNEAPQSVYTDEVQSIIDEGNAYIKKIREANNAIPGEEMSAKLGKMEDIMTRIFDRVKKEPDSATELRKLMKYYLPTTVKLLDAYIQMDGQPSYGDNNIENTRMEIEQSIDVINNAFGRLFDSMFNDVAMDISTDITTMKMMMEKDGLS